MPSPTAQARTSRQRIADSRRRRAESGSTVITARWTRARHARGDGPSHGPVPDRGQNEGLHLAGVRVVEDLGRLREQPRPGQVQAAGLEHRQRLRQHPDQAGRQQLQPLGVALADPSAIISSPVTADITSSVSDAAPGTRPVRARKARVSRVHRSAIATTRRSRFASAARQRPRISPATPARPAPNPPRPADPSPSGPPGSTGRPPSASPPRRRHTAPATGALAAAPGVSVVVLGHGRNLEATTDSPADRTDPEPLYPQGIRNFSQTVTGRVDVALRNRAGAAAAGRAASPWPR